MTPPPVPTGLQRLLRLAAQEERFRSQLLARRSAIAASASVALSGSERAILDSVPEAQLASMIDGLPPEPTDRRTFLREAALAAVAVLAGAAPLAGCPEEPAGPPPETPVPRPERPVKTKGITRFGDEPAPEPRPAGADSSPEAPIERPDDPAVAGGVRPDDPEPRPGQVGPSGPERPRKRITSFGHESGGAE